MKKTKGWVDKPWTTRGYLKAMAIVTAIYSVIVAVDIGLRNRRKKSKETENQIEN